jgi:hypothetical protein
MSSVVSEARSRKLVFPAGMEAEALASEAGVTLIDQQLSEKGRAE